MKETEFNERQRYVSVIKVIKLLDAMNTTNGSTKTVYRILTALHEHHFPVWNESVYDDYSGRTMKHWKSGVRLIYDSESTKSPRR